MNKRKIYIRGIAFLLTFILVFSNCYVSEAFAGSGKETATESGQKHEKKVHSNYRTDIIIKYRNESKLDTTINNAKNHSKASKLREKRRFKHQKFGLYEIGTSDNMNDVIEELNDDPNVEYAQPNYKLTVSSIPTDDKLGKQWAIYNDGQEINGYAGRATVDTNTLNAWNITMGSNNVVIGVLDTGINIANKDLKSSIYENPKEIADNGIDDDGNGYVDDISGWDFSNDDAEVYDSADTDTHGTYVASIIAGSADNGGMVGIAPGVKILPLKFISGDMGYTSDAIEAIEYAKNMGVKIINCSFGGTDNNLALQEAMKNSGILFICSAGNSGMDTAKKAIYPAAFDLDNIISVAAVDNKGVLTKFSSYGNDVDVAAPGVNVLGVVPGNHYDYYSGTSVSAAIVSGIAGLIKSNMPDQTTEEIKNRILTGVVKCTNLKDKVATRGRVDAFAALSGTVQAEDEYDGKGIDAEILPTEGDGKADTWYIMDERASIVERFHYGEGGINPASGNYSLSCTDMSVSTPGFQLNISRSYNSRNQKQTMLGRGWTFGFEGKEIGKGDYVELCLPNGSSEAFHLEKGAYVGEGTRATFVKNVNGMDILTTTDQYKYGFDPESQLLSYMEDKNGNRINLTYTSGKLTKITDAVGRDYLLDYNSVSLLSSVTDPAGRVVSYTYNSDNLLTKVTDPQGGTLTYDYDSSGYLTKLTDQNGCTFQQLTYSHDYGENQNKVISSTDADGATWSYSYDGTNHNTTITNNDNKKWTYWFDAAMFTIQVQDPEGKSTYTEYTYQDSNTYYGDVKTRIDRNGNRTEYEVDLATGNVIKIKNPDGGVKSYKYDQWHNVTEEVNEAGNRTFYIYDTEGKKLLKKAQPLDGTSNYVDGDTTKFAVTTYTYYDKSEAEALFGCHASGLQKSVTDPEGNTTTYTYNKYGDVASIQDAAGNVTSYSYDILGQKLKQVSGEGNKTEFVYDKNGLLIKTINPDGGIKRTTYDAAGHTLLDVSPNEYIASKDNSSGVYSGTSGTNYVWYDNGRLKSVTDSEGNKASYTYDIYGNKQTETKPNGSVYRYVYDCLNRLTKTYFQSNSSSEEVLLSEISYSTLNNGNTQTVTTLYSSNSKSSSIVSVKDYADREVMLQNGDYSRTMTEYNKEGTVKQTTAANGAITYYSYDALGNKTDVWKPVSISEGTTKYSWTGYSYDKAGNVLAESYGKSLVNLQTTTENLYIKKYTYENGLKVQDNDSEGRMIQYTYNKDNQIIKTVQAVNASETKSTEYTYNYLGKVLTEATEVRSGDIAGNSSDDNNIIKLTNSFDYDQNGNILSSTDATGDVTTYTYDKLNRILSTTKQLKDAKGELISKVTTSKTYNWNGDTATETDEAGKVTTYSYDAYGNQTKITDALGNVTLKYYDRLGSNTAIVSPKNYIKGAELADMAHTEFTYDALGRVLTQTEVYQKMTLKSDYEWAKEWAHITSKTFRYDTLGNVISTTDALGNVTTSSYNLAGLLDNTLDAQSEADGMTYTVRYAYNGLGQKVKEIYHGAEYSYIYDGAGNLLQTTLNGAVKNTTSYDYLGHAISITDGRSNTTIQKWNAFGKVSKTVAPGDGTINSYTTNYQYDKTGNLINTKDSAGKVTVYTYDSFGRNLSKTTGDKVGKTSITTSTTYDLKGNVLTQTDGNGNTTTNTYDALNRLLTTTNTLGQKTSYTYDANGKQLTETNYLGNKTTKVYDDINRLVEVRDAYDNVIQQILYNDADAQSDSYDALHNRIQYRYDKNLRQTGMIDAEGNTSTSIYDARSNVVKKKDGNGNITKYAYDGENHLTKVEDALGNVTSYTYDVNGNLLTQTDGNGNKTTYHYNAANLMTSKSNPEEKGGTTKKESYTYYANGLMASKTDRNGVTTAYTYDVFGRLLTEDAGGEEQSYTYDNNGNLLTMTDATGTTTRTYDELNRNITKTVPEIGTSSYTYDLTAEAEGGYSESTTDPKGNVTLNTYDRVGRLASVTVGDETTTYSYYANGNRKKITYPDQTTESYSYDGNNHVIALTNRKADDSVISSYSYTYDKAGNQLTKQEKKGTTTYTYDELNRLATVSEPDGKVTTYTYDKAGNRSTESVQKGLVGSATAYNYDKLNRLTSTVSTGGTYTRYLYDNNGNLISKSSGILKDIKEDAKSIEDLPSFSLIIKKGKDYGTGSKDLTLYTYDKYNRLTKVKNNSSTATYQYNAQGYRTNKTVDGKTTNYLYNGDKVVLETNSSGKQTAFQAYGSALLYRKASGDAYYYLYNAHGDVTALIDGAGTIAATYDYDAFGNVTDKTGTVDNHITYAGYQMDDETGLYYLNARYYDSKIARFITEDSYTGEKNDPLTLNLYTYCQNNPIIYDDPSGHKGAKLGDEGTAVSSIQITLIRDHYLTGTPDGKFGPKTQAAVKKYQKDHNLKPDGIVGEQTLSSMYGTSTQPKGSNVGGYFVPDSVINSTKASDKPNESKNTGSNPGSSNSSRNGSTASQRQQQNNVVATIRAATPEEIAANKNYINNTNYINGTAAYLLGLINNITRINIPKEALNGYSDNYKAGQITFFGLSIIGGYAGEMIAIGGAEQVEGTLITKINPNEIRYSQCSVNGAQEIIDSMEAKGWSGDPIDVVKMSDGKLTTVDNTRVLAAKYAGIDVEATVHAASDPIPADIAVRFTSKSGQVPKTWGEAVTNRINNQNSAYRTTNPNGSYITGWDGK